MPSAEAESTSAPPANTGAASDAASKDPVRPNRDALNKELKTLDGKIEDCKKIMDDCKAALDKIKAEQSKDGKKNEGQTKLQELRAATKAIAESRKKDIEKLQKAKEELKAIRDKNDDMRKTLKDLGVYSTEEVEKKIREMEYYLATNALSLKEEKVVIADIKNLSSSKKVIGEFDGVKEKRDTLEKLSKELSAKLDESKVKLTEARTAEDAQFKLVNETRDKEKKQDMWKVHMENKNKAKKEMDGHYAKIRELRADFNKKDTVWKKFITEKRAEAKERARREAEERKEETRLLKLQEEEEKAETLHGDEIATIDQLTAYLNSKTVADAAATKDDAAADTKDVKMDGMTRIGKDVNDLDDDVFGTKKGGKKAKKGNKGKKKPAAMVHDLEVMKSFQTLKLDAPLSLENIPETIKALAAKKESFLKARETARAKRKEEMVKVQAEIDEKNAKAAKAAAEGDASADAGDKTADKEPAAVEATA